MKQIVYLVFLACTSVLVGCEQQPEVDYRKLVRADGNAFNNEAFDKVNAQCHAAEAKSAVAEQTDASCKAIKMAGACVQDKVCP